MAGRPSHRGETDMRILIAENDAALAMFLRRSLEAEGHSVREAGDGETAIHAYAEDEPDLTILSLDLPKKDGYEVLCAIRSVSEDRAVLVLTGRREPGTKVRCLDLGADDCMLKPFSSEEFRARCRALLRRRREAGLVLKCGNLVLNRVERTVLRDGVPVALTNKEYALLEYLLLQHGNAVSRVTLLEKVWSAEKAAGTNVVDVYVNYLRRKLNDRPPDSIIQTVRGEGYRIAMQFSAASADA